MRLLGFKHTLSLQSYKFSMTFRGEWTEEPEMRFYLHPRAEGFAPKVSAKFG